MSSLVKAFLPAKGTKVCFCRRVEKVSMKAGRFSVTTVGTEGEESFDAVVLTAPVPQLLDMLGGGKEVGCLPVLRLCP